MRVIVLSLSLICLATFSIGAQLKADPELIDEFPPYGCENVLSHSAGFVNELRKNPKLTGIIIVYGGGVESEKADRVSQMIHRVVLGSLGFDSNVIVLRNSTKEEVFIQSWLSQSKELRAFPNSKVVATIPFKIEARYYFGAETGDPCSNNISPTFAELLKSHPNYIGQIVNFGTRPIDRAESAANWLRLFREEYGISRKQLRIFFKTERKRDRFDSDRTEFWIMPSAKK